METARQPVERAVTQNAPSGNAGSFLRSADFWLAYAANVFVMTLIALFYRFGDLINQLGGSDQALGLIVATGSLCGVAARSRLSKLTSRFGLHQIWFASLACMAAGAFVVMAAATNGSMSFWLVIGRILFAGGASGGLGLPVVFVQKTTPAESRVEALGFITGGVFVGMLAGTGLSELIFSLTSAGPPRFFRLFAAAGGVGILGLVALISLRFRDAPLAFETLNTAPAVPDAGTEAATGKSNKRLALLALAVATGYAFTFCTVYLTRYLAVRQLGGYFLFFATYCISALSFGVATKSWGKLIGNYRVILLATFVHVFGTLFFLTTASSWQLVFPAIFCGIARAMIAPALVGIAENSGARTVKGAWTNRIFLAMDAGNFLAAWSMGALAHAFGFETVIAVTAFFLVATAFAFVTMERASGDTKNLKRRKDDYRSRRKSDFGDGHWQTAKSSVSLVYVKKQSGIRLDGAWHQPLAPKTGLSAADDLAAARASTGAKGEIIMLIHADGDDFCSPSILETLQNYYIEEGRPVLRVNTSGKGVINYFNVHKGAERHGTVYEIVDECLGEIDAWLAWLLRQGYDRVTLVGHRLGGVKALYYAAYGQSRETIARVIALSPPRLCHTHLMETDAQNRFRADFERATSLSAAANPLATFESNFLAGELTSAQTFLDKFGRDERYDILKFAYVVNCPALVLVGSGEDKDSPTGQGLARELRNLTGELPHLSIEVVQGANHFYSNVRERAVLAIDAWLKGNARAENAAADNIQSESAA